MTLQNPTVFLPGQRVRVRLREVCPLFYHSCHNETLNRRMGLVRDAAGYRFEGHPYSVYFDASWGVPPQGTVTIGHYAWTELEPFQEGVEAQT